MQNHHIFNARLHDFFTIDEIHWKKTIINKSKSNIKTYFGRNYLLHGVFPLFSLFCVIKYLDHPTPLILSLKYGHTYHISWHNNIFCCCEIWYKIVCLSDSLIESLKVMVWLIRQKIWHNRIQSTLEQKIPRKTQVYSSFFLLFLMPDA